jgi:hypothetical protein
MDTGTIHTVMVVIVVLAACVCGNTAAQGAQKAVGAADPPGLTKPLDAADYAKLATDAEAGAEAGAGAEASPYLPDVWCGDIDEPETRADCWGAFRAGFNYYESGLTHRQRVFWWQHTSGRIIFFVVLGLVVAGVYFAWVQFRHDLLRSDTAQGGGAAQEHEVELSTSGLKVSSPVLGVIILALSLAFFYLYLIYVYPIVEIF